MQTESEFRRRLAAIVLFDEDGPTVSAVLAECRAAGLKLAPEVPEKLPERLQTKVVGGRFIAAWWDSREWTAWNASGRGHAPVDPIEISREAVDRYNAFPALEARAARLAAALGELLAIAEAQGGLEAERLRRAVAEGRAALAEGGK